MHVEFDQWAIPVVAPMSDEGRKMVAKEKSYIVPIFSLMKLNLHQMILNTISRCALLELRVKIYILLHYHTNWRKKPHMHGRHGHAVVEKHRRELWTKIRLHQTGRFTKMSEQMQANFPTVHFLGTALKLRKRNKNSRSLVYVVHKAWIRHLHVVVVQWRQRNVQ